MCWDILFWFLNVRVNFVQFILKLLIPLTSVRPFPWFPPTPKPLWFSSVILANSRTLVVLRRASVSLYSCSMALVHETYSLSEPHLKVICLRPFSNRKTVVEPSTLTGSTSISRQFRIGNKSTGGYRGSLKWSNPTLDSTTSYLDQFLPPKRPLDMSSI